MSSPAETEIRPRRPRRSMALAGIAVLLVGLVGWATYTNYRNFRIASFEPACRQALEAEQWDRLADLASRWADSDPDNADPWIFGAEAAQQQQDFERAAELLDKLPDDHPRTVPALLERSGLLFGALNRPAEGAATCRRILKLNPHVSEAWKREIFYYAMTLQRRAMVRAIHDAMQAGCDLPEHYVYLTGTDWLTFSNGYEVNDRWLTADPDNETLLVARAVHFIHSAGLQESFAPVAGGSDEPGDNRESGTSGSETSKRGGGAGTPRDGQSSSAPADAQVNHERVLREYSQRFPKNLELLAYFLEQAWREGDVKRMVDLLGKAPSEAIEDNRFWRYKGWVHARQRELEEAEHAFGKALRINPYDWVSRHQLADVKRRRQDYEAVERLEHVASIGKELRTTIMQLKDVSAIPLPLLERMADYCETCNEHDVARRLRARIDGLRAAG